MCCASNTRCWQTVLYYLNGIGATWFPFADDQAAVVSDHAEALAQAASLGALAMHDMTCDIT
jgi:hypothetical protein